MDFKTLQLCIIRHTMSLSTILIHEIYNADLH